MLLKFDAEILVLAVDKSWKTCRNTIIGIVDVVLGQLQN